MIALIAPECAPKYIIGHYHVSPHLCVAGPTGKLGGQKKHDTKTHRVVVPIVGARRQTTLKRTESWSQLLERMKACSPSRSCTSPSSRLKIFALGACRQKRPQLLRVLELTHQASHTFRLHHIQPLYWSTLRLYPVCFYSRILDDGGKSRGNTKRVQPRVAC